MSTLMDQFEKHIQPNRKGFEADPLSYSALAWHTWGFAQTLAGFPINVAEPPTSTDFKSPVLWLTQAHAMAEAARVVLQNEPALDPLPINLRGVCDSQ